MLDILNLKNKSDNIIKENLEFNRSILENASDERGELYEKCCNGEISKEDFIQKNDDITEKYSKIINDNNEKLHEYFDKQKSAANRVAELSNLANRYTDAAMYLAYMKGLIIDKKDPEKWYQTILKNPVLNKTWLPVDPDTYDPDTDSCELAKKTLAGDEWIRENFSKMFTMDENETASSFKKAFKDLLNSVYTDNEFSLKNPKNEILKELGNPRMIIADIQKEAMILGKEAKKLF